MINSNTVGPRSFSIFSLYWAQEEGGLADMAIFRVGLDLRGRVARDTSRGHEPVSLNEEALESGSLSGILLRVNQEERRNHRECA